MINHINMFGKTIKIILYIIIISFASLSEIINAEKNNKFKSVSKYQNQASIHWEKFSPKKNKIEIWKKISKEELNKIINSVNKNKDSQKIKFSSLNRSIVFNDNVVGPDIGWLVPPGLTWSKNHKFDASVRGHSRRKTNESFLGWNNGDAVGQFYYNFLERDKSNLGLNIGMRSVYKGKTNSSNVGEGLSAGFRWDYQLSNLSGIAFGAEQLLHFDGMTDTGRDLYFSASKVFGIEGKEDPFPFYVITGGVGTGKLAEGAIKGLCSDLLGGAGNQIRIQNRLCWAPIFSLSRVSNQKFSTFLEYNSHSLILGTSITPTKKLPLRGTFAVKLADEDNYELNNFSEMTWVFRTSLGF